MPFALTLHAMPSPPSSFTVSSVSNLSSLRPGTEAFGRSSRRHGMNSGRATTVVSERQVPFWALQMSRSTHDICHGLRGGWLGPALTPEQQLYYICGVADTRPTTCWGRTPGEGGSRPHTESA